jgi:hypothetical protein
MASISAHSTARTRSVCADRCVDSGTTKTYFAGSLPSFGQDVLQRARRLERPSTARRHHRVHRSDRTHLHHRTLGGMLLPALAQSTGDLPVPTLDEPSPIAM